MDYKPTLTDGEISELYLLRSEFGISAGEAESGMPAWEREMLVERWIEMNEQQDERPRGASRAFSWSNAPTN